MAADWLGISSAEYDSHCGDTGAGTLSGALDGTRHWSHQVDEVHWFILDLGETHTITKVRGRSYRADDPTDVDIYVSDDKESWGDAVKEGITTWQDTNDWVEIETTEKDGRYVKVVINDTEDSNRYIAWGGSFLNYFTIFDVYGEAAVTTHEWEGSDGIAIGEALVKTPMKMLSDGIQFSDVTIKEFYKTLTDPIAFTDVWTGYKLLAKILTDGIAIGEALVKQTEKVLSDGVAIGEALIKQAEKVLSDGIAISEALVKTTIKIFTDAIAFKDTLTKHFEKVLSDGIAFTDRLCSIFVGKIIRTLDAVRNNTATRVLSKIRDCWFK